MQEYMEFFKLLSAVGLGGIIVKILDIIWLQRNVRNYETNKWKRDKKINTYSKLANDLISQKEWGSHTKSHEFRMLLGEVFLLMESQSLITKVEEFYKDAEQSLRISSGKRQHGENHGDDKLIKEAIDFHRKENQRLQKDALEILSLLRMDMLS